MMCRIPFIQDYLEPVSVVDLFVEDVEDTINVEEENNQHQQEEQEEPSVKVLIVDLSENNTVFSDIEEIINRPEDHESSAPQAEVTVETSQEDRCDICYFMFKYNDLRMCYKCVKTFCDSCALPVNISILQCCNYHCNILWFCSEQCREGLTRATVRAVHNVQTPCV